MALERWAHPDPPCEPAFADRDTFPRGRAPKYVDFDRASASGCLFNNLTALRSVSVCIEKCSPLPDLRSPHDMLLSVLSHP